MTTLLEGVGLEFVQRSASLIFYDKINDEIIKQEKLWQPHDELFAEKTGNEVRAIDMEVIADGNFYEGHHPSFVDATPDMYPNLTVMAYRARRSALPFVDQHNSYDQRLMIESFVKAGPGSADRSDDPEMETIVNRRAQRMAEAIVAVVEDNNTLGGVIQPLEGGPVEVMIANTGTARREQSGAGDRYLWQLVRVEYVIQKHSELHR